VFAEAMRLCTKDKARLLVAWAKLESENFGDWDKATELLTLAMEVGQGFTAFVGGTN
jgi:hypothetical protein